MTQPGASEPWAPPEPGQAPATTERLGTTNPAATLPPRRRGYWIPALIAMAVLLAIGLAFGAGDLDHRGPSTLAGSEITQDLAQGIQAKEGTHTPPEVRCPDTEPVRAGLAIRVHGHRSPGPAGPSTWSRSTAGARCRGISDS